jgi:OmpA-OmpF porin, OOP family
MNLLIVTLLFVCSSLAAQNENTKLLIPVPYKELQSKLYSEGKVLLNTIEFDSDNNLLNTSEPQIKEISRLLNGNKKMKIYIVVHTNNNCLPEKCLELSQQRAEKVVEWLGRDYMVSWNQMTAKGIGAFCPVTTNITEEGKKLNERVEIVLQ